MSADDGDRYVNAGQLRLLAVLEALAADPFDGADLETLRCSAHCSRDQAFRAVRSLVSAGWAEEAPRGGWRPTPKAACVAERIRLSLADMHRRYFGGADA